MRYNSWKTIEIECVFGIRNESNTMFTNRLKRFFPNQMELWYLQLYLSFEWFLLYWQFTHKTMNIILQYIEAKTTLILFPVQEKNERRDSIDSFERAIFLAQLENQFSEWTFKYSFFDGILRIWRKRAIFAFWICLRCAKSKSQLDFFLGLCCVRNWFGFFFFVITIKLLHNRLSIHLHCLARMKKMCEHNFCLCRVVSF